MPPPGLGPLPAAPAPPLVPPPALPAMPPAPPPVALEPPLPAKELEPDTPTAALPPLLLLVPALDVDMPPLPASVEESPGLELAPEQATVASQLQETKTVAMIGERMR